MSSSSEPRPAGVAASFERSTYATPRAVTKTSSTRVPAGRLGPRPIWDPRASSSTTTLSCCDRSFENETVRSSMTSPGRSPAGKKSLTLILRSGSLAGSAWRDGAASPARSGDRSAAGSGRRSQSDQRGAVNDTTPSRRIRETATRAFAARGLTTVPSVTRPGRGAGHGLAMLAMIPRDATGQRGRHLVLVVVRLEEPLLLRVADEGDLHQHGRHPRPHQDPERRLLDAAPLAPRDLGQLLVDAGGQGRGLLEVLRLGHVPQDEGQVGRRPRRAAATRDDLASFAAGQPAALFVAGLVGEEIDLAPARAARGAGVGVDGDEQVRLVVVREGRAVVEGDLLVLVAGEEGLDAEAVG